MSKQEELWDEESMKERLESWAEDEHRNYVYPIQAKSILKLLENRDEEIAKLKQSMLKP